MSDGNTPIACTVDDMLKRSDERIGSIANIKTKYDDDEIGVKKLEKQLDFEKRKLESEKEKSLFDKNVELLSSQGSAQSVSSGEVYIPTTAGQFKSRNIRGTHNILNERVVATFDRCKISDRDAVFITTAICQSLVTGNLNSRAGFMSLLSCLGV
ncbi:uncharacterized protein LOC141537185 [Cotesia typhae]|uniref:uncharacterized protein LOC141537185 n=1 Tax=Cotesia typhae TaxID=2053667 RepID=UPI003D69E094